MTCKRDGAYASQVANERPMLATRIHHEPPEESGGGENVETEDRSTDQLARMNAVLNSGRGISRGRG